MISRPHRPVPHRFASALLLLAASVLLPRVHAQDAPDTQSPGPMNGSPAPARAADSTADAPPAGLPPMPRPVYDPAIFQKTLTHDQLAFLSTFDGAPSGELMRDRQFRKLVHAALPDCMFHYGRDKPLYDALDEVILGSSTPIQIRDNRYLLLSGHNGAYLAGRGFVWIDLQQGIMVGGFYFRPTNGEPTPSLVVFSRQVKEDTLTMGELPAAFAQDLVRWSQQDGVPALSTRYFITGANRRILLEHDEDFCSPTDGTAPAEGDCEEMIADAADLDLNAAYYLDAINYATNGTAWMISPEQASWISVRDRACGSISDPLACRIRMTRERVHRIIRSPPIARLPRR